MLDSLLLAAAIAAAPVPAPLADSTAQPSPAVVLAAAQPAAARPAAARPAAAQPAAVLPVGADTVVRRRQHAVEVSDAYSTRLTIHRWASYTIVPLFAAQYYLGDKLLGQRADLYAGRRIDPVSSGVKNAHVATAIGVASLFTVNTVTGLWNLYDSRAQSDGRTTRLVHTLAMLTADAGFVATGIMGNNASEGSLDDSRRHRNVALGSMAVATASSVYMWFFRKD